MEPHNLRQCVFCILQGCDASFFTCARPGRSNGQDGPVPESIISTWVEGLPGPATAIVSLLGRKNVGKKPSEYVYYPFCGKLDCRTERDGKVSFQEWLDQNHPNLHILVREHPTVDSYADKPLKIPLNALAAIKQEILHFIGEGRTVVVMDSGGVGRTSEVCEYMKATAVPARDGGEG